MYPKIAHQPPRFPCSGRSGRPGHRRLLVLLVAAVLTAATLLLAACGQAEPQPLLFGPAPWTSGERHTLSLTDRDGQGVGSAVYTLNRIDSTAGEPTWAFTREIAALGSQEIITVTMDVEGFRPQASRVWRLDGTGQETVEAQYSGGQVDMVLNTRQNIMTTQRAQVPSDARETVTLPMLLRALPLAQGYATQINIFMPIANQLERINVHVAGEEALDTEGGSFATWVVELTTRDSESKAWIGKEAPYPLVKYLDGRNNATLELTEYAAGE
jgi:hypothetical protein